MANFFIKIFMLFGFLSVLLFCLVLIVKHFGRTRSNSRRIKLLQPLVNDGLFDIHTLTRSTANYIEPGFLTAGRRGTGKKRFQSGKQLTHFLDMFLKKSSGQRFLLISGDPGTGKTSFMIHYYLLNQMKPEAEQLRILLIPMKLKNALQRISELPDKPGTILFLDGIDENTDMFDNPNRKLSDLIHSAQEFQAVIMTCEIGFLPRVGLSKNKPGRRLIADIDDAKGHAFELMEVFMAPLKVRDALKIISSDLPFWRSGTAGKLLGHMKKYPEIKLPPLVLPHLAHIFPDHTGITSSSELYSKIVENAISLEKTRSDKNALENTLGLLAVNIFTNRSKRRQESIDRDDFNRICESLGTRADHLINHPLALISETPAGKITFSHRSFMEHLFVRQLTSGNEACFDRPLTKNMQRFLFAALPGDPQATLNTELQWLLQFQIKAIGIKPSVDKGKRKPVHLFKYVLSKNRSHAFLSNLNALLTNPVFYEFGWDPQLPHALKKAVNEGKTSLLKLSRPRRVLFIDRKHIEITLLNQNRYHILINPDNVKQYTAIEKNEALQILNRKIRIEGIKLLNTINQSGSLAVLPDSGSFKGFTLYFLLS